MEQPQKVYPTQKENTRRIKKGTEEIFETRMTKNFPQINVRHQPQIQEAQKTPSRINAKKLHLSISYSDYRKYIFKKS